MVSKFCRFYFGAMIKAHVDENIIIIQKYIFFIAMLCMPSIRWIYHITELLCQLLSLLCQMFLYDFVYMFSINIKLKCLNPRPTKKDNYKLWRMMMEKEGKVSKSYMTEKYSSEFPVELWWKNEISQNIAYKQNVNVIWAFVDRYT